MKKAEAFAFPCCVVISFYASVYSLQPWLAIRGVSLSLQRNHQHGIIWSDSELITKQKQRGKKNNSDTTGRNEERGQFSCDWLGCTWARWRIIVYVLPSPSQCLHIMSARTKQKARMCNLPESFSTNVQSCRSPVFTGRRCGRGLLKNRNCLRKKM